MPTTTWEALQAEGPRDSVARAPADRTNGGSPIDRLLEALSRTSEVHEAGDGQWRARCPAHSDKSPSLSVGVRPDGTAVLTCHAGCDAKDVVAVLGLEMRDLFPQGLGRKTGTTPHEATREWAEPYVYSDESMDPLFRVLRTKDKHFTQQRYEEGEWRPGVQGVRRVIYRLPQVLDEVKDGQDVYIVEGEKCVHALLPKFFSATTNPGGALKWRAEYNESLRGARVVILPDNDEVGRRHAEHVAAFLQGVATDVRVVELPGLPEKGDVVDWFAAGHTRDELRNLAARTALWEGPRVGLGTAPVGPVRRPLNDILAAAPLIPDYVVDEMLALGAITSVGGYMGAGKSPFVYRLVKAIMLRQPFLGFATQRREDFRVAYLTQDPLGVFGPIAKSVFATGDDVDMYMWDENLHMAWPDMVREVAETLEGNGLMVVDVVLDWSGAVDENDAAVMTQAYKPLVGAAGTGIAVLAVVHTVKSFDSFNDDEADIAHVRGSGAVVGNSAIILLYKKPRAARLREDTRVLKFARSKFGQPKRTLMYVRLTDEGDLVEASGLQVALTQVDDDEHRVLQAVRQVLEDGAPEGFQGVWTATADRVRTVAKMNDRQCRELLSVLSSSDGPLDQEGAGKRGHPYHYSLRR